ncbi:MAG: hypothetical protein CMM35_12215, partial [Rhodospirillaceae bacterium]|nr:hypothetical protein [Rhodospirillaceae bacterium]
NNFNAPKKHINADRASLPTLNFTLCQRTQHPVTGLHRNLSLLEKSPALRPTTAEAEHNHESWMLQRQNYKNLNFRLQQAQLF